jgi:hypothetical protein
MMFGSVPKCSRQGPVIFAGNIRQRRAWQVSNWTRTLGLPETLPFGEVALMACCGAMYHHEAESFGGAVFCKLFLSENRGLNLNFSSLSHQIPLTKRKAMLFGNRPAAWRHCTLQQSL